MGRTIWEILTKKQEPKAPSVESQVYNPLELKIGAHVSLNVLDLEELRFSVQSIQEYTRNVNGNERKITDYILLARRDSGDAERYRLRLVPLQTPDGERTHSVVLLKMIAEFDYDQPYHEGLEFDKNGGVAQEGDAQYWRIDDLKDPWKAKVVTVSDDGQSVKKSPGHFVTYWDFWRETTDEGGNKVIELYIVEMDGQVREDESRVGTGQFHIWTGPELDQLLVEV